MWGFCEIFTYFSQLLSLRDRNWVKAFLNSDLDPGSLRSGSTILATKFVAPPPRFTPKMADFGLS